MVLKFAVYHVILILWLISSLASAQRTNVVANPGCDGTCGSVQIPFPFGMKEPNCYADKWFQIECRNVSGNEEPFLKLINISVINISISGSYVSVQNPIQRGNCRDQTEGKKVDLRGSPFVYSQTENTFYAFGCNSFAFLNSNGSEVGGCVSICDKNDGVFSFSISVDTCNGRKCCTASLPNYLTEFNTTFEVLKEERSGSASNDQCNFALIRTSRYLLLDRLDTVPAILEWEITNFNVQLPNSNNRCYPTNITSSNKNSSGRRCQCNIGFQGNAYVWGGCTENLPYIFYKRSKPRAKWAIIGVFSSLGSILLLLGIWWLYKHLRKRMIEKRKEKNFKENGGLLLQQRLSSGEFMVERTKLFSSKDLDKATDHFNVSRVLGKGGQDKSDVYSFGVVLIELLTRQKPISLSRRDEGKSLASYFLICMEENRLFDILDDRVMKEGEKEHIMEVAILAKRCINLNGKKRPTMKEVTMELERIQSAGEKFTVQHPYPEEIDLPQIEAYQPWVADSSTRSIEESRSSCSIEILPIRSSF
ncbi:hypothetical protein L6164_037059 [Bauhinia variegata]|uniref:Uncharacterized protein n=1 Tax=Bauhinia variegata TaxID=167791 RepID=A0ACB9KIX3_BAUVA|nr:hypothetical protein L6164_037059 [Bauhinia variegata]